MTHLHNAPASHAMSGVKTVVFSGDPGFGAKRGGKQPARSRDSSRSGGSGGKGSVDRFSGGGSGGGGAERGGGKGWKGEGGGKGGRKRKRGQFAEMRDDVISLGLTQLEGREKRLYEERRVETLGGGSAKRENVPYHILMGMKRKDVQRRNRREAEERESGVVLATSQKRKKPKRKTGSEWKEGHDFGLQEMHLTRGGKQELNYRNGVLKIKDMRRK